ncbi:MAG: TIGR02281 family clan AA aspartic protease [Gammaproteobacteria bacterium]|jgi:aspartyl protease family protein
MQDKDNRRDFISRAGTAMTTVAWIMFLFILFGAFDYLFSQRNNPNQNIVTNEYYVASGLQKEIVLQRNAYGHYVSSGTINDHEVVFLLDTGASDIAVPESLANDIGLTKNQRIVVSTANGNTRAFRTRLASVAIGDIKLYDLSAIILTNMPGKEILLGMNFLKHFEITQKGKTLTIKQ